MTIAVSGSRSEIAPAAAIPPPGMLMSRRQTAGRSLERRSTARIRARRLAADLEAVVLEHGTDSGARRRVVVGDHDPDPLAHGRRTSMRVPSPASEEKLEAAAERLGALAHAHEPEAADARMPGIEAGAVVSDAEEGAVPVRELHGDVLGSAVPARVRDRLADDADERLALVG